MVKITFSDVLQHIIMLKLDLRLEKVQLSELSNFDT